MSFYTISKVLFANIVFIIGVLASGIIVNKDSFKDE